MSQAAPKVEAPSPSRVAHASPALKRARRAAFRFFVYGSILVAGEVAFYTIVKVGRLLPGWLSWLFAFHWRVDTTLQLDHVWEVPVRSLYGQASLWMFFVYASICLFGLEPAYRRIKRWPLLFRGLVYMLVILAMECASGWALKALTGLEIWYYADGPLTLLRYTSLAIAPMWLVVGLLSENFLHIVDKLARVKIELIPEARR
jgi:hypothetical protein